MTDGGDVWVTGPCIACHRHGRPGCQTAYKTHIQSRIRNTESQDSSPGVRHCAQLIPRRSLCQQKTMSQFISGCVFLCVGIVMTLPGVTLAGVIHKIPLYAQHVRDTETLVGFRSHHGLSGRGSSLHRAIRSEPQNETVSLGSLSGHPGQGYYVKILLGEPPQELRVLVDTGSSNFAVAAAPDPDISRYYNTSSSETYENLGTEVDVPYTQGHWHGVLGQERVALGEAPQFNVTAQVAFITESDKFFINGSHWEGILGMAYAAIARPDASVEPYFDSVVTQTGVDNVFSMQLCGGDTEESSPGAVEGSLVLGGTDSSLYTGPIRYVPLHRESYYEVVLADIRVNNNKVNLHCKEFNFDKTIVDSGTTNIRLPPKVYTEVVNLVRTQTIEPENLEQGIPDLFWSGQSLLCVKGQIPWSNFPSLQFYVAASENTTYRLEIHASQYLRQVDDDVANEEQEVSQPPQDCYKFAIAESEKGLILGAVFMQGFYIVFDRGNKQLGFAHTACPAMASTGREAAGITGPHSFTNTTECAYVIPDNDQSSLLIVAYVMAGVCGLCLLPILYLIIQWQWRTWCPGRHRNAVPTDDSGVLKEEDFSEQ